MVALIQDHFVRRTDVSSPTFEIIIFYLHVYDLIVLTLKRPYIKTTACRYHQFLLLQVDKKIFTTLILPDTPGRAQPALPTLQEYLRMSC